MATCPTCGFESDQEARFCARCGHPLWIGASAGRRAPATVLFCDLVGSTALGESVDPEILRELLSRYYATCGEVMRGHGGLIDKFIGDAVLCVFGLPVPREDDALRACRAACDVIDAVAALNVSLQAEFGVGLQIRIGVHTGEAVSGDPRKGEALIAGDVLNTAARLETAAGTGEILIGEPTYRLVQSSVRVEPVEPVDAKGKAEPVPAYRLISALRVEAPPPAASETPFVGRAAELAALAGALGAAIGTRRAALALLVGEPGIGKSRLVSEFTGGLPADVRVLTGRCLAYGEGITYWPLRDMLDELIGETPVALEQLLGDADENAATIEQLLRTTGHRTGPVSSEETFAAVARLFTALARQRTLVVVVDDLHWAEPRLLELLDALNTLVADAPVLVIGTSRTDLAAPHGPLRARTIAVPALDGDSARALLSARGVVSEDGRSEMARAAGGNPLFLEQLHAAGASASSAGGAVLELRALLAARLGELDAAPREVLEAAAVVGHEFWTSGLRALLPDLDLVALIDRLRALEQLEFIVEGRAQDRASIARSLSGVFGLEGRYSFRHGLIRDAARHAMSKRTAADLHERFAAFVEEQAGSRAGEYEASIAWHLEEAARLRAALQPGGAAQAAQRAAALLVSEQRRALERDDPASAEKFGDRAATMMALPALRPDMPPDERRAPGYCVGTMTTTQFALCET